MELLPNELPDAPPSRNAMLAFASAVEDSADNVWWMTSDGDRLNNWDAAMELIEHQYVVCRTLVVALAAVRKELSDDSLQAHLIDPLVRQYMEQDSAWGLENAVKAALRDMEFQSFKWVRG